MGWIKLVRGASQNFVTFRGSGWAGGVIQNAKNAVRSSVNKWATTVIVVLSTVMEVVRVMVTVSQVF